MRKAHVRQNTGVLQNSHVIRNAHMLQKQQCPATAPAQSKCFSRALSRAFFPATGLPAGADVFFDGG